MIEKSAQLMNADLLVHMEKRADVAGAVGKGISGSAKGVWDVIGAGTRGAAEELGRHGLAGKALGLGVRAAPLTGAVVGSNYLVGNPAGKHLRKKIDEFRVRRAMQQAVYDPQSGMMY
jgi:hypothetical protein